MILIIGSDQGQSIHTWQECEGKACWKTLTVSSTEAVKGVEEVEFVSRTVMYLA